MRITLKSERSCSFTKPSHSSVSCKTVNGIRSNYVTLKNSSNRANTILHKYSVTFPNTASAVKTSLLKQNQTSPKHRLTVERKH